MPSHPDPVLASLLENLEEAFQRRAWHGPNLLGSVTGLAPETAEWRPGPGRHNIQELIVHAAYWKYAVTRRLTGAKRGGFPLKGSNWFARPGPGDPALLRQDLRLLKGCHQALYAAASGLRARDLGCPPAGSSDTCGRLLRGAAAHDLYHAGQIQLIKRLYGEQAARSGASRSKRGG
jgi:uncharacterized damage-inducible protein DinB